jgi:two-component system, NtrC family, nitrogen regulation sensor histidine kinase NtrY
MLQGMSNKVIASILIPVMDQYYLETNNLPTRFVHDPNAHRSITLSDEPTRYVVHSMNQIPLFSIKRVAHTNISVTDTATIVLRLAALLFFLIYIHLVAESITHRSRALYGILFLAGVLFLCRAFLFLFPDIFSFRQFRLFNPLVYASNTVNRSLGDLLGNAIFLCWVVMFAWYNSESVEHILKYLKGNRRYIAGFAALFILILTTFQLANVVRSLVENSKISFKVTDFFSLDIYTIIGFIVLALLCLTYYYFSRLLFRVILPAFYGKFILVYFALALTGLVFLTLRSGNSIILFHLPVLLWLVIYTFLLSQERFIINRIKVTITGALFWIFIFSVSLAVIILQGNRENETQYRKELAEKYDQLTDPSSVSTLSIVITYLDNRFLKNNFQRFKNQEENRYLRDSIINENFTAYTNGYDTKIYVFDSLNRAVNNEDSTSFAQLNTVFSLQSRPTKIPDLYYHELSFDRFTYITKREIRDTSAYLGSFFMISTPKRYGNAQTLYPELFRKVNNYDEESAPSYSYAIYNNKLLTDASSKYPFQITLTNDQIPNTEFDTKINDGYDELWYRPSNEKVIIIAKKHDSLIESITVFSYLFCAFLLLVGLLQLLSILLRAARDGRNFNAFFQINIRSQIHGTVIFISILSFLIIGAATISFFINRYKRNNIDRLSLTAGVMVKEMQKHLDEYNPFSANDSTFNPFNNLKALVNEVADIHNVDVNVYDTQGNLLVTSDEEVYKKGILSSKMHPLAYYHLNRMREVLRVQEEAVSSLHYLSIYNVVRDKNGNVVNYLNIPYFSSQLDLKQEISNFLVALINLNAFIFLVAGVIAVFITNKITQSFSLISNKMKAIQLGRTNEEIEWSRNDEIGELVRQYNKMVHQLEQSAQALAKSEREGAWREMARQVAHEIKNPLTPMKLSIQYLQKAIYNNQSNVKELTSNVANTLIEQIDHLSKIAADFAQFANIDNRKIELIDLHQVVGALVDLYLSNPNVKVIWNKVDGSIIMKADKTHMNRLFTNLLANAVDACENKEFCMIAIDETREEDTILIRIRDNGEGIPESMRSKIFTPNFTTKSSGTGLGLAMCKTIVEQAQGSIWFETKEGEGTTFFVQLPIIG